MHILIKIQISKENKSVEFRPSTPRTFPAPTNDKKIYIIIEFSYRCTQCDDVGVKGVASDAGPIAGVVLRVSDVRARPVARAAKEGLGQITHGDAFVV